MTTIHPLESAEEIMWSMASHDQQAQDEVNRGIYDLVERAATGGEIRRATWFVGKPDNYEQVKNSLYGKYMEEVVRFDVQTKNGEKLVVSGVI